MNLQLNNTSVYLGGQCKWDIIIGKEEDELVIQDFHLSPLSPIVPYNTSMNYLINNSHGYNLKTFYKETEGYFWNTDYYIDRQSGYDITRYAGPRRRSVYSNYKKQFEYLCPVWLDKVDKDLKFTFNIYLDKEHEHNVGSKTITFSKNNKDQFHDKFLSYFNNWLDRINLTYKDENNNVIGNNKVMYVDFENHIFKISGVNVNSGELSDDIELNYMIDNLTMYERPLVETDNMLSELFKNYHLITTQLFNFNFCFNLEDIVNPYIIQTVVASPIYIDMVVSMGDDELTRKDIFTNYTEINKYVVNNFIPFDEVTYDYNVDKFYKNYKWTATTVTKSLSTNVLDYLRDYEYPGFYGLNKLTQDILHWNYVGTDKTFNIYNGYRGIIQAPHLNIDDTIPIASDGGYTCDESYDNFSNEYACDISRKTYIDDCNSLNWIQPKGILYVNGVGVTVLQNHTFNVVREFGLSLNDVKEYWSDNSTKDGDDEINDLKLLVVWMPKYFTPGSDAHLIVDGIYAERLYDDKYFIIYVNQKDNLLLANLLSYGNDFNYFSSDLYHLLSRIYDIVVSANVKGLSINFGTEIYGEIDVDNEWNFFKSTNHVTFPVRSSGTLTISTIDENSNNENFKYSLSKTYDDIVRINEPNNGFELVWDNEGNIINLYKSLDFYVEAEAGQSWVDAAKEKLLDIYNTTDTNKINYIYDKYDVNINYEHGDEDTIIYNVKMNLL